MKPNPGYVLIEMNIWIPGVNNSIIKSWHCYRFRRSVSVYYTYNVTRTDYLPLSLLSETCRPSDMFRRALRYFSVLFTSRRRVSPDILIRWSKYLLLFEILQ